MVYVSKLILDYLVVGPWSNPEGFNFPETRQFSDSARMPLLFESLRIHAGIFIALAAVIVSWFVLYKTYLGFQIKVSGLSLKTAKYAGFKGKTMILIVFMISGACAGLANPAQAPLIMKTIKIIVFPLNPAYFAVFKLRPDTLI